MTATAIVQARMDPALKEEATLILEAVGLTPSDAIRILFKRVVAERAFPMDLLVPNEDTLEAIREARTGKLHSAATFDEMLAELNADDLLVESVSARLSAHQERQVRANPRR